MVHVNFGVSHFFTHQIFMYDEIALSFLWLRNHRNYLIIYVLIDRMTTSLINKYLECVTHQHISVYWTQVHVFGKVEEFLCTLWTDV